MAGPYCESDQITLEDLARERDNGGSLDRFLQPISSTVRQWPQVQLNDNTAYYVRQGQPVIVPHAPTSGWVVLLEETEQDVCNFLGVGEILDDGRVAPRRLVVG
jgi:tRNA pseudouridine55 synthase